MLSHLRKTATGVDKLPFWALKFGADFISRPITALINMSIHAFTVPTQWKVANITPVPKNKSPVGPVDYRPISITSVLSRVAERLITRKFLFPPLVNNNLYNDQFAFRPTGSTTAAIITIINKITGILETQKSARMIAFDFSKAFDTIKHKSVMTNFGQLDLPDHIYNWLCSFIHERRHMTTHQGQTSEILSIDCGVVQGSVIGPVAFIAVATTLQPVHKDNIMVKYADDTYIIIPEKNFHTTTEEIDNVTAWADDNNLKLNTDKSKEIIFSRPRHNQQIQCLEKIERHDRLNILGVTLTNKLKIYPHVDEIISKCSSQLYALKILRSKGLPVEAVYNLFNSLVLSRMLYASPAWWGLTNANERQRLQAFINRSARMGYCQQAKIDVNKSVATAEKKLFTRVSKPNHVLYQLLPEKASTAYHLRPRPHDFALDVLSTNKQRDYLCRMLFAHLQ